jgi:tetratricopeptide (TPR) repeat protein
VSRLRRALEALGVDDIEAVIEARTSCPEREQSDDFEERRPPDPSPAPQAADPGLRTVVATPASAEQPPPPPPAPGSAATGSIDPAAQAAMEIDLTSLLEELGGASTAPEPSRAMSPQPEDLDEVFERIQAETDGDPADESAEYFALARTYLDMEMPDEAIGSLQMAARSPRHRFSAASMLAQIYRDRSDLAQAIEWFERAAEAPAPGIEESRALFYDLADVLETLGETARALAVFLELQSDAPGYRDIAERVRRLSKVETEG